MSDKELVLEVLHQTAEAVGKCCGDLRRSIR